MINNNRVKFIQSSDKLWVKYPFELALLLIFLLINSYLIITNWENKCELGFVLIFSIFSYVFLILDKKIILILAQ